jgi:hypothetical protein
MTTETLSSYPSEAPPKRRPSRASRRAGYVVAALVNLAILYAVNVWPGWDAVPFLTLDTERVLGLLNASLVVAVVVNLAFVAFDPRWFKALGDALTSAFGFVVTWAVLAVFPFDFTAYSFNWTAVTRVLLVVGLVGSLVAVVANLVTFVRAVARGG